MRKWKPSNSQKKEYARKMREIENFLLENEIEKSWSGDSYYFMLNGINYRVSNHSVEASNKNAYDEFGNQKRELYHENGRCDDVVYIHASKTRIIEIYNNLKAGKKLNSRGVEIAK